MPSVEYEKGVSHDLSQRAMCCIHYRAMAFFRDEQACAREVPVRAKACAANGGSNYGIALRLPCDGSRDPLFSCPWFEAVGVDRACDEMIRLREAGARTLRKLARELESNG